jgi:hypothetical protein
MIHNNVQWEMPRIPKQAQRPQYYQEYAIEHEWSQGMLTHDQVKADNKF